MNIVFTFPNDREHMCFISNIETMRPSLEVGVDGYIIYSSAFRGKGKFIGSRNILRITTEPIPAEMNYEEVSFASISQIA